MRILVGAIFLIVSAALAAILIFDRIGDLYRSAALEVCDLVEANYYRSESPEARQFVKACRVAARRQPFLLSKTANLERLNYRLSMIRSSHLAVYSPSESKMMWENQGLDTGIRARMIDARLVIYHILPLSPASRSGMKAGDVLLALNDQALSSTFAVQNGSGVFRIQRGEKNELRLAIRPEVVTEDLSPTLETLGNGRAILRIPSFLSNYFEREKWLPISRRIERLCSLVIDLRGNAGGSFPGMLRSLSPFICDGGDGRSIGAIYRDDRENSGKSVDLVDDLAAESQVRQLSAAPSVNLRGFRDYGCFDGFVTVLVDSGTSSVAEIFAEAFLSRPKSLVWGQPTAGQVVMAKWFPITAFGSEDYLISIPIAGYRTEAGRPLEERGVHPQAYLDYDLKRALAGRDSWLEDAVKSLPTESFVSN